MSRQEIICWIDTEFSGTDPHSDEVLEVAGLLTDMHGEVLSPSYHALLYIENLSAVIQHCDAPVQAMHDASGLWEDLWLKPSKDTLTVDAELSTWLAQYTDDDDIKYLGGNTVTADRNHLAASFPTFYAQLSYRSIDATSLAIFLRLHVNGGITPLYHKEPKHRALSDVHDAVREYQHYVALQKELQRASSAS